MRCPKNGGRGHRLDCRRTSVRSTDAGSGLDPAHRDHSRLRDFAKPVSWPAELRRHRRPAVSQDKIAELRRPERRAMTTGGRTPKITACVAGFAAGTACFPCRTRRTTNRRRTIAHRQRAHAARMGRDPADVAYDMLLENNGRALIYRPLSNYTYGNLDTVHDMLAHDATIVGLGDGGAHVGILSDASALSTMLTHWTRDRNGQRPVPACPCWPLKAHHRPGFCPGDWAA